MTDTESERQDVLSALRSELGGLVPFQVLVQGRITDCYPSGWTSANTAGKTRQETRT